MNKIFFSFLLVGQVVLAQNGFGKFDNGKMWTFDQPPFEHLEKTYGFKPSQGWMDSVRMSALRFSNYCSASFVSSEGLVMTNHHCARESATSVQRQGEDFNKNSFLARSLKEERKVPGLFVDQLILFEDVTERIKTEIAKTKAIESQELIDSITNVLKKEFSEKPEWKNLEIQVVTFYKGAKYSIYGFKRHKDVRLVFVPELQLGFFGGDPDNFTYPRYALDCAFFRVYENDQPLKTTYYFKFNTEGVKENEPVFAIGNPGRTERLHTLAQLEFSRIHQLPLTLEYIHNRIEVLKAFHLKTRNDSVLNRIFSLENSNKALKGMLKGLNDPELIARKNAFEEFLKKNAQSTQLKTWIAIDSLKKEALNHYYELFICSPRDLSPKGLETAKELAELSSLNKNGKDSTRYKFLADKLSNYLPSEHHELERDLFNTLFKESEKYLSKSELGLKIAAYKSDVQALLGSRLNEIGYISSLLKSDSVVLDLSDPLIRLGYELYGHYKKAKKAMDEISFMENKLNAEIAKIQFAVFGNQSPPDANFNLRFSDGIVKGYSYNGTIAPVMTTYYGLYDRYYSNIGKKEWELPLKWLKPNKELLRTPLNFVSTNDIIGGNSGSPMINRKREAVGLIFDGNIESLPGRYIFMDESNRTVSVHAGGIVAALKHIYKAKRLVSELSK